MKTQKVKAMTTDLTTNPGTDGPVTPRSILTFNLTENVRRKLGPEAKKIESIKVVRFSDRMNTRGVYVCTDDEDVLEEIAPTPMQACGLVTILNGKFVLVESGGETTLHFSNAPSEDSVIDQVHLLSENNGLADGIRRYKSMVPKIEQFSRENLI
jgi:hypothetical protein